MTRDHHRRRREYRERDRRIERERTEGKRWRQHRGRQARAAAGRCAKRQWRDLDEAIRAVVGSLAHPDNPVNEIAIYVCRDCGWFHQSRSTRGDNVVYVVKREAKGED